MSLTKICCVASSIVGVMGGMFDDRYTSLRPRDYAPDFEVNAVINKEF